MMLSNSYLVFLQIEILYHVSSGKPLFFFLKRVLKKKKVLFGKEGAVICLQHQLASLGLDLTEWI